MTDKKPDPTSDASRSDPKTADAAREKLAKDAEKGLEKALKGVGDKKDQ